MENELIMIKELYDEMKQLEEKEVREAGKDRQFM